MRVRFVGEIRLVRVVVFYVYEVVETNYTLVVFVNVPIVLGKGRLTHFNTGFLQYWNETLALDCLRRLDARQLQASRAQVNCADQALRD